jgi:tyrosine-protein phosphatase SIW14
MANAIRWALGVLLAMLLLVVPAGYAWYRAAEMRNFHVVREGVLYRSGQPTRSALKKTIRDYGIKTVITLRDGPYPGATPPDAAEEAYCRDQELTYCRISPSRWGSEDGSVPAEEGVRKFLEIMHNPENYPVLMHCFAGIHRSGIFVAIYHMEFDHLSNAQAIAELKAAGYTNLDEEWDVLEFLEKYRPSWRKDDSPVPTEPRPAIEHGHVHQAKHKGKKHAG